jgi:hypothetical protein
VKLCCGLAAAVVCVNVAIEQPAIELKPLGIAKEPTKLPDALFDHSNRPLNVAAEPAFDSDSVTGCPGR